ncbi:TrmH family RNA methyltransferase [Gillisia mitskevichiae]|uniref:TrmH family RNA methyltransferase n=1 Tax=Gillisia mitskevichiae TaxID=270921 RepID=A0A495P446_9FLAO|nr:RNA methyltransferase [Gillisia mitskevichiae]RKS43459.1 TrmH family RNA methyltransferase [Gillisia mitskevichiae]
MVSKSQIKLITSLEQKKHRTKMGLFVVEGKKGIEEVLESNFELHSLFTTQDIFNTYPDRTHIISEVELKKISRLKTAQIGLAIFKIPFRNEIKLEGLVIALDGVRDPGNLGTIIRLCDWFGVETLLCSLDTVDCYNSKVVQATMGSITRVKIHYMDLPLFLKENNSHFKAGTFLEGENVYSSEIPKNSIIVLGNEANGISAKIESLVEKKINIPQFSMAENTESLNVATATAILLSEYRRKENY